ncbi:DUF1330 domain-containing protein [Marinibaculum pumilum]|uniref:DUF1330 domain-containing protein n=1 Tax=Marinibaculum pumilum TaxID=1766165 RepID=A0ABV7L853_9PROT
MAPIDVDADALEAMAGGDPDEPVVMLNLLRYRETAQPGHGVDGLSGRQAYEVYGRRFACLHPRFGGEPVWMGRPSRSLIGGEAWDLVILVRYPTRRQFVEMLNDPDYQAIAPIRAAALADSRLIETRQLLPHS